MTAKRKIRRTARRLFRLCVTDGALNAVRALLVARRIAESRPRDGLAVLSAFQRLVRLDREGHTARIEGATTLPQDVRARIETGLTRRYGPGLEMSFVESPALIGGVRIAVGSDVYDGSVRARLAAIEAHLAIGLSSN